MREQILTAPQDSGDAVLGKTLPSLLYEVSVRYPNPCAFNHPDPLEWRSWSTDAFREQSEEIAAGLMSLGLQKGDRVVMLMESDVHFALVDMGCLLIGLVDVPIYLTHAPESIFYIVKHSEAKCIVLSDASQIDTLGSFLPVLPSVQTIIYARNKDHLKVEFANSNVRFHSLNEVRQFGRPTLDADPFFIHMKSEQIEPQDLATIIYTSGTTGDPKGVMLSHENLTFNALTAFSELGDYRPGPDGEVALSFLPLSHVFARALNYGYLAYGTSVYFTRPDDLSRELQRVQPTVFASVPRVIEKVYNRILEKASSMTGPKKHLLEWALDLARKYELGKEPEGFYRVQLKLADKLVYAKWREALGGRVRYIIAGGAALNPELANIFAAAGITILQGYGLTETSPVITFNRPRRNRAGTVGQPLPHVEVKLADDGEILTRGPHVMMGYYKEPVKTGQVIDDEGWFHTGDIGEITPEGFLRITDRKKDLFKLSTGKYVIPQVLETRLTRDPLIEQALVVGSGYKFCAALIFPNLEKVRELANSEGLDPKLPVEALLDRPEIKAKFQALVDEANEGIDQWSQIKHFVLIPEDLNVESGALTPTFKVRRSKVIEQYDEQIKALYESTERDQKMQPA